MRAADESVTANGSRALHRWACIQSLGTPIMLSVALPLAFDDLDPVVDRLVGNYGEDRRAQVERVVVEAWHALRSIQDSVDRRVTTERLARIELHARSETRTFVTDTDGSNDGPGPVLPAQRSQARLRAPGHGMWSVEPAVTVDHGLLWATRQRGVLECP